MDTLTSLRVFREVVEGGSFVAAAHRLNLSTAMASKHMAHLERQLGARLLNRTSRHLSLTEAGTVYLEQCREALDSLRAGEAAIGRSQEAPRGVLRVTAPVWCATRRFADALTAYKAAHPEVVVDIRLENRRADLVEEGYDLALRVTRDPSPTLIVRPLCVLQFHLVATPAFLKRAGRPRGPADLERLGAILPTYVNIDGLELIGPAGKVKLHLTAALKTDDTTLSYHAVHAGLGMAYLPDWLVGDDLRSGALKPVLPQFDAPPLTLFAAYTSRKYMTAKVRSFIDFLSTALVAPTA
ncbi:MAG: LysR family transcriptional regulator [Burkholderiales bacterium]